MVLGIESRLTTHDRQALSGIPYMLFLIFFIYPDPLITGRFDRNLLAKELEMSKE